jgi:restriction system protein
MSIPDYQTLMLPLLESVSDGAVYSIHQVKEKLSAVFSLTPDERRQMLPSGTQPLFDNRVAWAKTYLLKAGLLESPQRAQIKITKLGKDILLKKPIMINIAFLKQFDSFNQFIGATAKESTTPATPEIETDSQTPTEKIDSLVANLKQKLAQDLMEYLKGIDPYKFESLVLDLLQAMGYGGNREEAAQVTRKAKDGGIDGIINEDRLGLDKIYVQAKKWEGNVTISAIRDFGGTLLANSAHKGIFITTSDFPKTAHEYVEKIDRTIILINGKRLTELMIEYGIGVTVEKTYIVKDVNRDYFES